MHLETDGQPGTSGFSNLIEIIKKLKVQLISIILLCVFLLLLTSTSFFSPKDVYEVKIGGHSVGYVEDQEIVGPLIDGLIESQRIKYDMDLNFNKEILYEKVKAKQASLTPEDLLEQNIASRLDLKADAAVLYIDGIEVLALKDEITAQELLEKVKNNYVESLKDSTLESVQFTEVVDIRKEQVRPELVKSPEDALKLIMDGKDEIATHALEDGESFWTVAKNNNISVDDLISANPGLDVEKLQIGQEIKLNVQRPYVTVETLEKVTYKEDIPYDTKTEYSDKLYKGQSSVKEKGSVGSNAVTAEIIKHNGAEISRTVLEEKIISKPVARVVVQGTKPAQSIVSTASAYGILSRGTLTSSFGSRGGAHKGVDIAAPKGNPIYAWKSGTVTFSGYHSGGYGYLVIIDHGNGYVTYYGHNSKNLVNVGQKVSKGQNIALVGSTGDSTGNHVHFEVRINGVPVNPLKYIN